MAEQMTVEQQTHGAVIRLKGQFIGGDETDALRETFKRLTVDAADPLKYIAVDLSGVSYLNSTALGVFISAHSNFSKRGGKIALCGASKSIENIFVITKLTLVFEMSPTVEEAIAQFS
jgi:anti-sigma B factor antagonist